MVTRVSLVVLFMASHGAVASANGENLYGVHWWDFNGSHVGAGATGGWSTETVLTHSAAWWQASFFDPLYHSITASHGASIITRVDYDWGQTVPSPTNPDRATWVASVLGVVNVLGDDCTLWIIGNEPNIISEGGGWPNERITPQGYAAIYHEVRSAIKAIRPNDEVLIAGPSPGGIIPGVRWISGNDWLAQAIAAVHAIPGAGIDGFAIHAYGNPFASAAVAVQGFHNDYTAQLAAIDAAGEPDAAVYITEWNRSTSTTGNLAANEQVTADFIRGAFADVDAWNRVPGHHNIVSMSWFVHNQDYGGWETYSLEYWQTRGNPAGHPGDLWTAFQEGAAMPAGLKGTRPTDSGPAIGDFDNDGDVDGDDFLALQRSMGITAGANDFQGDANGDRAVNGADLAIWRGQFGSASGYGVVPEPGGLNGLVVITLLSSLKRQFIPAH